MKKEPALIVGALIAALTALQQALTSGVDWKAALPLVAGAVIRFFVTPANPPD